MKKLTYSSIFWWLGVVVMLSLVFGQKTLDVAIVLFLASIYLKLNEMSADQSVTITTYYSELPRDSDDNSDARH